MSVLTNSIKKRQQWHHMCEESAARNRRSHSTLDKFFYVAALYLLYMYRVEAISFLVRVLESL